MIGNTISNYKILEKLGGGGMGVVYKAQDLKLDRFVAIKILPPTFSLDEDAKQRFIHEAKTASALEHNHIWTIQSVNFTCWELNLLSINKNFVNQNRLLVNKIYIFYFRKLSYLLILILGLRDSRIQKANLK